MNVYLLSILAVVLVTTVHVRTAGTSSVTSQIRLLLDEQKTLRQSLETRVRNLRQQAANLNSTIVPCTCATPGTTTNQSQVAYTGNIGTSVLSSLNTGSEFLFNHNLVDVGGAFHAADGHFIAPVDGLYGVSLSVYMAANLYTRMELVADQTPILKVQTGHRVYRTSIDRQENQGTNFAIANLTKGMEVWPRYIAGNGQLYAHNVPTFSVFLLHQF